MAFKTPVVDRIPTYPGRVKLTPVSGQTDTYDLTRADQPIEEGTPINKALFDQKAYCLTGDVVIYVSKSGNDQTGDGTSSAPYLTIQKAIDSIPKWLDGYTASISVYEGVYDERLTLDGFQGGTVVIGSPGRAVTVRGIYIITSALVSINVNITRSASLGGTPLHVINGSSVMIGTEIIVDVASGNTSGIVVEGGSVLRVVSDLFGGFVKTTVKNSPYIAVYATEGSKVVLGEISGSGNATGLHAASGAVITYGSRSISATTMQVTAGGGRIYSGAQTSIPNY